MNASTKDLTGQQFGELTAIQHEFRQQQHDGRRRSYWLCRCTCGNEKIISARCLLVGDNKSCGCRMHDATTTHGHTRKNSGASEYGVWTSMKARCTNPNNVSYPRYGGRGITVCERWLKSYENFIADMGRRPDLNHTLERKDNDKGYTRDNCIWATTHEQSRNTRRNRFLTLNGTTKTITDWSLSLGFCRTTVRDRIDRGWSVEEALTLPLGTRLKDSFSGGRATERRNDGERN